MTDPFRTIRDWLERLWSRHLLSGAIRHDGLIRKYLLYVPRHAQGEAALPLVLMLHGGAGKPSEMARMSDMHRIAEREGFIVAYPAGTRGRLGFTWNPGGLRHGSQADDVGFVRALVAELRQRYAVDPQRVYAAGMSIGGMLAYRLACSLSENFAAIGVVAGVMTTVDCDPVRPVSVIHIHGTEDHRVPLRGGRGRRTAANNNWPPVLRGIDRWREINGCMAPGETLRPVDGLVGHRFSGVADVELWLVEGGHHVWPGGPQIGWRWWRGRGRRSPIAFSASEKVWSFFAAHPRTEM